MASVYVIVDVGSRIMGALGIMMVGVPSRGLRLFAGYNFDLVTRNQETSVDFRSTKTVIGTGSLQSLPKLCFGRFLLYLVSFNRMNKR